MQYLYIIAILISLVPYGISQIRFENPQLLTKEHGLPSNIVSFTAEDEKGNIWISTRRGLARYDGNRLYIFDQTPSQNLHNANNYLISLLNTGDSLWIGSDKGVTILDHSTLTFSDLALPNIELEGVPLPRMFSTKSFYQDRQKNIWIAAEGCGFLKLDIKSGKFDHFPLQVQSNLPGVYNLQNRSSLVKIFQDTKYDSIMWGFGMTGIFKLNQHSGKMTHFFQGPTKNVDHLYINMKICGYQDKDRTIYSGSWSSGLSIFYPETGNFEVPDLSAQIPILKNNHLFSIMPINEHRLYFTYSRGIFAYDNSQKKITPLKKNIQKGEKWIFGVEMIDSQGRCYYGTPYGLTIADPITEQFRRYSLAEYNPTPIEVLPRIFIEDLYPGYLTVAGQYTDGLYHVNLETGETWKSPNEEIMKGFKYFQAWGMDKMNNDEMLVLASDQLFVYHVKKRGFTSIPIPSHLQARNLNSLKIDDKNVAWIGSRRTGLLSLDLKSNTFKTYNELIDQPSIGVSLKDQKGNIWMTSNLGHNVYSISEDTIYAFQYYRDSTHNFQRTQNICECPNGEIWVSGGISGLGRLSSAELKSGIIQIPSLRDHQGNPVEVLSVTCNEDNVLWGLDKANLLRINRENWQVDKFSFDYGIKDFNPIIRSLSNGDLIISSRDAFYTVDPDQLKINTIGPKPYISQLSTRNDSILPLAFIENGDSLRLSPKLNILEIEFSSICHTLANQVKYEYMLEGLNEQWKDPGEQRSVTYAYLKGGDYTFRLRAANNEGIWNEEQYALYISVGTPWYNSWIFYSAIGILITFLIITYNRQKIKRITAEEKIKSDFQKQLAEAEMRALRAQMNPHFIFNCLNSIESNIIRNDTEKASLYLNDFSRLIRLILQNSRSSYVDLTDELESLDLYLKLERMRLKDSFKYQIILEDGLDPYDYVIPPMLIQPFVENSIWHGLNNLKHPGIVTITITESQEGLKCVIEDNGIGREAAQKIKSSKKVKRASMGMRITKDRLEKLNKVHNTNNTIEIIDLYDNEGNASGTKVILSIPL